MIPELPLTYLPVITGTKAPALRSGFRYTGFTMGEVRNPDFMPPAGAQWGVVCAPQVMLFVIDVDDPAAFAASATGKFSLPPTVTHTTAPTKEHPDPVTKFHVYVWCAQENFPRQGPTSWGDVKALGFVVAAGGVHADGNPYVATGNVPVYATWELRDALEADRVSRPGGDAAAQGGSSYTSFSYEQVLGIADDSVESDNELKDIAWALAHCGCGWDEAFAEWSRVAVSGDDRDWGEQQFSRHWDGAFRKYEAEVAEYEDGYGANWEDIKEKAEKRAKVTTQDVIAKIASLGEEDRAEHLELIAEDLDLDYLINPSGVKILPSGTSDAALARDALNMSHPFLRLAADAGCLLMNEGEQWATWGTKSESSQRLKTIVLSMSQHVQPPVKGTDEDGNEVETEEFKRLAAIHKKLSNSPGQASVASAMLTTMLMRPANWEKLSKLDSEPYVFWAGGRAWDLLRSTEALIQVQPGNCNPVHIHSARRRTIPQAPERKEDTQYWDALLEAIWPEEEVRNYAVRQVAGTCLWGDTSKRQPVLHGDPGGAKSTFAQAVHDLLGTYAVQVSPGKLIGSGAAGAAAEEERAVMIGARMVWLDEPPTGSKQAISEFKEIASGTGTISASRKYENRVVAPKRYNLLVCQNPGNALLFHVQGVDERVTFIPCDGKPEATKAAREDFLRAFSREAPYILAKLIMECARYRAEQETTVPTYVQMRYDEAKLGGNSFVMWVLDTFIILPPETAGKDRQLGIGAVRNGYNEEATRNGWRKMSNAEVRIALESPALGVHVSDSPYNGKRNLVALRYQEQAAFGVR